MENTLGINAGFLWRINHHYLYFVDSRSQLDPFTNPILKAVFHQASAIVSNDREHDESIRSNIRAMINSRLTDAIRNNFTAEQIDHLIHVFSAQIPTAQTAPSIKRLFSSEDPCEALLGRFYSLPQFEFSDNQGPDDLLIAQAARKGKPLIFLFGDAFENTLGNLELQINRACLKGELLPLYEAMADPKFIEDTAEAKKPMIKAWEYGSGHFYQHPGPTEYFRKKMERIATENLLKVEKQCVAEVDKINDEHMENVADEMLKLMQQHQGLVFILSAPTYYDDLLKKFQRKGTQIDGPIKTKINPVGLFWEIESPSGKRGYLLGSVHLTHGSFTAFNHKILKCFEESQILAVETDLTRPSTEILCRSYLDKINQMQQAEFKKLSSSENESLLRKIKALLHSKKPDDSTVEIDDLKDLLKKIQALCYQELGLTDSIDLILTKEAKLTGKTIEDLENPQDHFGVNAPDPSVHITSLKTLRYWACPEITGEALFNSLKQQQENVLMMETEIWGHGFLELLELATKKITFSPEEQQKDLIRNRLMAERIHELTESGRIPFSVVGSSHMIGKFSLLKNLSDFGYKIQRIIYEEPR